MHAMTLLTWFGGKTRRVGWILPFFPDHHTYVEPFGGSMALLLAKPPSPVEVYNDCDEALVNFWRVVRLHPDELRRRLELTPYAHAEWTWARASWREVEDPIERAARWWTVMRQGFGATDSAWGFAVESTSRGMSSQVSAFLSAIDVALPRVHERLRRVQIDCDDWLRVVDRYDRGRTFFYLDPPYVPATRRGRKYAHELTLADHERLVTRLLALEGAAILSGYDHPVYAPLEAAGWIVERREVACQVVGRTVGTGLRGAGAVRRAGQLRTECLWISPAASLSRSAN